MPATVKSLDERTEEIAEDVSALKMRSEDVSEELTALKARTAEIASDVSATKLRTAEIAADVTLIKSQLVELNREFAMSRAKIDSTLGMQRWIGIFAASVLVTVVFSVINGAERATTCSLSFKSNV